MRLIDADALFDNFRKTIEGCKKWEKDAKDALTKTKAEHAQQDFVEAVLMVKAAPTVDAVPVVFCRDCELHDNCYTEDVFKFASLNNDRRFCGVGKRKGE